MPSLLTHLECTRCGRTYDADAPQTLCPDDGGVLYARYNLARARRELDRDAVATRAPGLWQIPELMPVRDPANIVTLGEGGTPLLPAPRLGARYGFSNLFIKEEGTNPTGSFKARGLAAAVSRAKELGARALTVPTAGNAGAALAAYGARAGLAVDVFMPADTPRLFQKEVRAYGAALHLVDGLIDTAGAQARAHAAATGAFDVSTLKEPYRCEGKKTMGYELAQAYDWALPDVIVYPTGGGTGIVGMWKAFEEMEALGWIGAARPRMISVQAEGCAPIVRAWAEGAERARPWEHAATYASGVRVPAAVGDYLILGAVRASGGSAVAVAEDEIAEHARAITTLEGIFAAPEGGATLAALLRLRASGAVGADERIVLFNTGTGLKYPLAPGDAEGAAGG
ncbi:MAG TPA: threonine synthase [Ktedonobacterales bacterium]|nr:threonine synthase [Ktedonobacterales bacterium]